MNLPIHFNSQSIRQLRKKVRSLKYLIVPLVLSMTLQGCNVGLLLGYLIGGPPSVDPAFDISTDHSMTSMGVKVVVVCYAPKHLKWDFDQIDNEMMKAVADQLSDHHIEVVDPHKVQVWLDEHPDWEKPQELGKDLEATYVIYIDLSKFSLHEKGNQNLYRGRAEATVSVIAMEDDGEGDKIFTKNINSQYPHAIPRSTHDVTYSRFKKEYRAHLSDMIGRLFYHYYNGEDFDDAT